MKTCFKCSLSLPLSEFYKHPQMGDGYLGKCKSCTKKDTAERHAALSKDHAWLEREMERHRLKTRKYRQDKRPKPRTPEQMRTTHNKHKAKFPDKFLATNMVNNAIRDGRLKRQPCSQCGAEKAQAHHEDYTKPLEVVWLCTKHHAERHVEIRRLARAAKHTLPIAQHGPPLAGNSGTNLHDQGYQTIELAGRAGEGVPHGTCPHVRARRKTRLAVAY